MSEPKKAPSAESWASLESHGCRRSSSLPRWARRFSPPDPPARCGLPDPGTANLVWQVVTAIRVWEQAKNYGEPERFMGPKRVARFRAAYERATGHQSVRPEDSGS